MFGSNKDHFHEFLLSEGDGLYELRPEFSTQRQVEQHFADAIANESTAFLRQGLYDLISNVILFEEEGSNYTRFHFRFSMEQTVSFRHLDPHAQDAVYDPVCRYYFPAPGRFLGQGGYGAPTRPEARHQYARVR